jgi:hypothetical protein
MERPVNQPFPFGDRQVNYRWYFDYDVPNNGNPTNVINTLDYYQFQQRYGSTLPPP